MHIVAHRGFNGRYPEMSPLAYEKALELPIHGVECDVRLSADGKVVCTHDATMSRVAGSPVVVRKATLAELKKLNIGDAQRMLTLDELIEMVMATDKHLYIEAKHPVAQGRVLEEQIALRLRYARLLDSPRIHFISFSHAAIRRMTTLAPKIETCYLRRDWEQRYNRFDLSFSRPSRYGLSLKRGKAQPELVSGKSPYMWTVNNPEDMRWAYQTGVGIMATDYPDVAVAVLRYLGGHG